MKGNPRLQPWEEVKRDEFGDTRRIQLGPLSEHFTRVSASDTTGTALYAPAKASDLDDFTASQLRNEIDRRGSGY